MSKTPETKTEAIRIVVEKNIGLTNKQIEEEVRNRWGINVGHNLIVNTIGSMKDRKVFATHSDHYIEKAKQYLADVGSPVMANKLLKLAEGKCRHD